MRGIRPLKRALGGREDEEAQIIQGDDRLSAALETYAFQFSVLLPKRNRKTRSITSWRAWLPGQSIHRACPFCLNDPTNPAVLLAWKLLLMLSCPLHGC